MTEPDSTPVPPAPPPATTPLRLVYWSARRELWENRSVLVAPLAVAGVFLFGFLLSALTLPHRLRAALPLDPDRQRALFTRPYDAVAILMILLAFVVGVFYCLEALHGERRDRSILFWKSLPVSDLTTVLAKAAVPLVVLPLLILAIVVTSQTIMLLLSSVVLLASGHADLLSRQWPLFQMSIGLLYGLIVLALWHAPIYAWLLLVSAWARRATFLWAVLPFLAISVVEKVGFGSAHFAGRLLRDRLMGHVARAFVFDGEGGIAQLTPGRFLATPGLWIGLAFAGAFLAGAARLRRYRGPI